MLIRNVGYVQFLLCLKKDYPFVCLQFHEIHCLDTTRKLVYCRRFHYNVKKFVAIGMCYCHQTYKWLQQHKNHCRVLLQRYYMQPLLTKVVLLLLEDIATNMTLL
jgi:hypothetical protein